MNPTRSKREKTVALTHMELLKLTTPTGHFWHGCECEACDRLRVKVCAVFPTFAREFVREAARS